MGQGETVSDPIGFYSVPTGTLHHVGFVVASIQMAAPGFAESIDGQWDGKIIHDPNQAVRVAFVREQSEQGRLLELVEPAGEESPVTGFLKRGGGLHHICYEADDLEKQLDLSRKQGGLITRPPLPAVAFGGRRIAWVYTRHKLLIEYLERQRRS
jgi:methylmalonyl-CoA/ethylmalonyl-CoA epimerase